MFIQSTRYTANVLQAFWAKVSSPAALRLYLRIAIAIIRSLCLALALAIAVAVLLLNLTVTAISVILAAADRLETAPGAPVAAGEINNLLDSQVSPVATAEASPDPWEPVP